MFSFGELLAFILKAPPEVEFQGLQPTHGGDRRSGFGSRDESASAFLPLCVKKRKHRQRGERGETQHANKYSEVLLENSDGLM